MLRFNNYPPQQAGDAQLGSEHSRRDIALVARGEHALFSADAASGLFLFGLMASHAVSDPRIDAADIEASAEDSVAIMKPVVDEVGELVGNEGAISFARGALQAIRVDFPDFREIDDSAQHHIFQSLISGVSEEAREAVERRNS